MLAIISLPILSDEDVSATQTSGEAPPADASAGSSPLDSGYDRTLNVQGYVDQAGIITMQPDDVPEGSLLAYPDETSTQAAIERGEISGYYLIPADYLNEGSLIYINPDFNPTTIHEQTQIMRWTLFVNLSGGDTELAARAIRPMNIQPHPVEAPATPAGASDNCLTPGRNCESNPLVRLLPNLIMLTLYMCIVMSSSLMLNTVNEEKKNRAIENLMMSISPRQMLAGKTIGMGLLSLVLIATWIIIGIVAVELAGQAISLPEGFSLPPGVLFWSISYFLLGFAMYASLMAGAGALVPNIKETPWVSFVILIPLFVPLMPIPEIMDDMLNMNGQLLHATRVFFSLFPLSAPTVMIMRIVEGSVPLWQPILSAILMVVTAIFIVRGVARMFRAQTLLSGQPFSIKPYLGTLFSR